MATVAELNRDMRLLAQVVDSLVRNLNMYPNLERDIAHLKKQQHEVYGKQDETSQTIGLVRQDIDLLRLGHREIIHREEDIEGGHSSLKKGNEEINARQDELKSEIMHLAGI
ncbi:unnamed protein product [Calypogeia fissa]